MRSETFADTCQKTQDAYWKTLESGSFSQVGIKKKIEEKLNCTQT